MPRYACIIKILSIHISHESNTIQTNRKYKSNWHFTQVNARKFDVICMRKVYTCRYDYSLNFDLYNISLI